MNEDELSTTAVLRTTGPRARERSRSSCASKALVGRALIRAATAGELGGRTIRRGELVVVLGMAASGELAYRAVPLFRSLVSLPVAWD